VATDAATAPGPARPAITFPALGLALCAIAILAFVLPAFAVRTLHARRLRAVELDLAMIAGALRASPVIPANTILAGPGERPRASDERWNSAAVLPLARAAASPARPITADPWGNAYVACSSQGQAAMWVISAGPDGILQTPLSVPRQQIAGDDAGLEVR
jgi:type II secretory pathway pseudopilin PulG